MEKICTLCDDSCEECNEIRALTLQDVVQRLVSYKFKGLDIEDFMFEHKYFVLLMFHFMSFENFIEHEQFRCIFNKILTLACILGSKECMWIYMIFFDFYICDSQYFTSSSSVKKILCSHVKTKLPTTPKTEDSMLLCDCFMLYVNTWGIKNVEEDCIKKIIFQKLLHDPEDSYFYEYIIENIDNYRSILKSDDTFLRFLESSNNESSKNLIRLLNTKNKKNNTISLYEYVNKLYINY
jgi:hypothetical protein